MSYDNQNPIQDKLINSDGSIKSFNGDSISDTTEENVKRYKQSTPIVNKFLYPDGAIKDKDGNTIQESTSENVKKYSQSAPIPAKFLHEDGSIDENIGGGSGGKKYNLYAYEANSIPGSIGYTEKKNPIVGDILLLPRNTGTGPITDPTDLKLVFTITQVSDDVIYAKQTEESSPIIFTRKKDNDYEETINDIRDLTDVSQNGLLMSQKGTAFKGLNINVEGGSVGELEFLINIPAYPYDINKMFKLPLNVGDSVYVYDGSTNQFVEVQDLTISLLTSDEDYYGVMCSNGLNYRILKNSVTKVLVVNNKPLGSLEALNYESREPGVVDLFPSSGYVGFGSVKLTVYEKSVVLHCYKNSSAPNKYVYFKEEIEDIPILEYYHMIYADSSGEIHKEGYVISKTDDELTVSFDGGETTYVYTRYSQNDIFIVD